MREEFICPITGLKGEQIDTTFYRIEFNGKNLFIRHPVMLNTLLKEKELINNKHILAGAILNEQLFEEESDGIYCFTLTSYNYLEKLKKVIYPKSPESKLDNLFLTLYQMQKFDGEVVNIHISKPEFYYKHFFKSYEECNYYMKELHYQDLINYRTDYGPGGDFSIKFKGLNYYLNLKERGDLSNKCFIAMSFGTEMKQIREVIRTVVEKNKFEPIIIDEQKIENSQTINDAIIAAIKGCKFCIADFSQQKNGVYFESGFALGLNKQVIYTCQKEWFDKSHFDINHFPHIIYNSNEELEKTLDIRIKAWVK